jgi:hypothetical protein
MVQDLENIEKVFIDKYNEKTRATKVKAGTVPKTGRHMPGKRGNVGSSNGRAPKKGPSTKYCKASKRTRLLSPSIPQRSPGKRFAEIQTRWLI